MPSLVRASLKITTIHGSCTFSLLGEKGGEPSGDWVNLLFYQARIESSLALNPRSRRIVSSTPRNRSISVRLLAPTLAILHLLGLRAAPLPR